MVDSPRLGREMTLMLFRNLLLPLAVVCIGLGAVLGGRPGQVLLWLGTVLGAWLSCWSSWMPEPCRT